MTKKELEKHYLSTTYSVFIENKQYDIYLEQPLPKFIQQLVHKEKTVAILTAWNPRSQPLPESENNLRNNQLNLRIKDYPSFKALGQGKELSWFAEESFFIVGIKQTDIDKLAVEFEQYAYIWLESGKEVSLVFSELW